MNCVCWEPSVIAVFIFGATIGVTTQYETYSYTIDKKGGWTGAFLLLIYSMRASSRNQVCHG